MSWKGRCASPRCGWLGSSSSGTGGVTSTSWPLTSPKYRMGQFCWKNRRKELSSVAAVLAESQKGHQDGACTGDGRTMFDDEVGGDDQRNSGDGGDGGQYMIRRDKDVCLTGVGEAILSYDEGQAS